MEQYQSIIEVIALSMGVAWASGLNLYAVLLVLGLGSLSGYIGLPEQLSILENPAVIGAAGLMYLVEFTADKTPGVDTLWDGLHTFIRLPAGALLAAGMVGEVDPSLMLAAGIVGGGVSATSHAVKTGSRVLINTSPEPFSNWAASLTEDIAVVGGLWLALQHPVIFIALLAVFILISIWLIPKLWRAIKYVYKKIKAWLGGNEAPKTFMPEMNLQDSNDTIFLGSDSKNH